MVLGHGLGGTQDSGLQPFAEAFATAGFHAVTFDYRGFGASEATQLPGVDASRVVLGGISLAGGHVVSVAAARRDVVVVVPAVPLVDGLAAARLAALHHRSAPLLASTGRGLVSAVRRRTGGAPAMIPVVARPGEVGALTLPGAYEDYLALATPTWRNEIAGVRGPRRGAALPGRPLRPVAGKPFQDAAARHAVGFLQRQLLVRAGKPSTPERVGGHAAR